MPTFSRNGHTPPTFLHTNFTFHFQSFGGKKWQKQNKFLRENFQKQILEIMDRVHCTCSRQTLHEGVPAGYSSSDDKGKRLRTMPQPSAEIKRYLLLTPLLRGIKRGGGSKARSEDHSESRSDTRFQYGLASVIIIKSLLETLPRIFLRIVLNTALGQTCR